MLEKENTDIEAQLNVESSMHYFSKGTFENTNQVKLVR